MNSFSKNPNVVNQNNKIPRYIRRSKAFKKLPPNKVEEVYRYIKNLKESGKGAGYKLLNLIMWMTVKRLPVFFSVKTLARKCDVTEKHMSRLTSNVQRNGLLVKKWRGYRKSRIYRLTNIFKNIAILFKICELFPFMKREAALFKKASGKCVSSLSPQAASVVFALAYVTYIIPLSDKYILFKQKLLLKERENSPVSHTASDIGSNLQKLGFSAEISTPVVRPNEQELMEKNRQLRTLYGKSAQRIQTYELN